MEKGDKPIPGLALTQRQRSNLVLGVQFWEENDACNLHEGEWPGCVRRR